MLILTRRKTHSPAILRFAAVAFPNRKSVLTESLRKFCPFQERFHFQSRRQTAGQIIGNHRILPKPFIMKDTALTSSKIQCWLKGIIIKK